MDVYGLTAGLMTAICWSGCSLFFESAGHRIGSLNVNLIRLVMAFFIIAGYLLFSGFFMAWPFDATAMGWLLVSGIVGLFIGDLCLFRSFLLIGVRKSLLIMSLAPPMTALLSRFMTDERLTLVQVLGMLVTVFGVVLVILDKRSKRSRPDHPLLGITLAFLGAFGQALGGVLGRVALGSQESSFDFALGASLIRTFGATVSFILLFMVAKRLKGCWAATKDRPAMIQTFMGSALGPVLGITCFMFALTRIGPSLTQTFASISPVLVIPVAIFVHKERISALSWVGAFVAIGGVTVLNFSEQLQAFFS